MITGKQIRQQIAGLETENILVIEQGYRLIHNITYKGWLDEAFTVDTFKIVNTATQQWTGYATLQEALKDWDKVAQPIFTQGSAIPYRHTVKFAQIKS